MNSTMRVRGAERAAALLLAVLAVLLVLDGLHVVGLLASASPRCSELCLVFSLTGWLLSLLGLAGFGLAIAIWTGTRLGPLLGLGVSLIGVVWAASQVGDLAQAGFTLGDEELIRSAAVTLAFAATSALLLVALVTWVRRFRALGA